MPMATSIVIAATFLALCTTMAATWEFAHHSSCTIEGADDALHARCWPKPVRPPARLALSMVQLWAVAKHHDDIAKENMLRDRLFNEGHNMSRQTVGSGIAKGDVSLARVVQKGTNDAPSRFLTSPSAHRLPEVAAVLAKAQDSLVNFTVFAKALQDMALKSHVNAATQLAEVKAEYQRILEKQAKNVSEIELTNADLRTDLEKLELRAANHRDGAVSFRQAVGVLRKFLLDFNPKLDLAADFASDSLNETDDAGAEELRVIAPTPEPARNLDHFLSLARAELGLRADERAPTSLLEVRSRRTNVHNKQPSISQSFYKLSNASVALGKAQEKGSASLKARFDELYKLTTDKTTAMLKEHKELLQQHEAARSADAKMSDALLYLNDSAHQLEDRARRFQTFVQDMSMALEEAEHIADQHSPLDVKEEQEGTNSAALRAIQPARHLIQRIKARVRSSTQQAKRMSWAQISKQRLDNSQALTQMAHGQHRQLGRRARLTGLVQHAWPSNPSAAAHRARYADHRQVGKTKSKRTLHPEKQANAPLVSQGGKDSPGGHAPFAH